MSKIRASARGERCQIRFPGICNHDPETTVFAHYRLAGYCGTGIKPPDFMGAYACSDCLSYFLLQHRLAPTKGGEM